MVVFSKVRLGISPEVNALATIIIGVVALGVILASWQIRKSRKSLQKKTMKIGFILRCYRFYFS